ncbi:MAG: alpha-L-fucosidase [Victivallales bacterium]|nr:alpha-L-fucosidase [Victivallales bacterium]
MPTQTNSSWFEQARYGMFIHFGLYSLLGRGEWVWNREQVPFHEYTALADSFTAGEFDAEALCDLAVRAGMRYVVITTMHHDGFRLYDTDLSEFCTTKTAAKRDLIAEIVDAARSRGLKIGLYHSLNNWHDKPDAVDALEDEDAYGRFIENTFSRIKELVTKFNPVDILWYDGWWPFNANGWQAMKMNEMVREIQPHIFFNGRNGLPGNFSTPEGHMAVPDPWRPWEACMTLNNSWGYHAGDKDWKRPVEVVNMLATAAKGRGNLLLNIGPRGDGSVPEESVKVLEEVGSWLGRGAAEAIYDTDLFTFNLRERGSHRGDWCSHGPFTSKGNNLYLLVRRWPGSNLAVGGIEAEVREAYLLGNEGFRAVNFKQEAGRTVVSDLPANPPDSLCPIVKFICEQPPLIYQCGGLRVPIVAHPHYDPCPSDIAH